MTSSSESNRVCWDRQSDKYHGDRIRLLRSSGLTVDDLVEIQPPAGARSTYRNDAETAWAQRRPMEEIWKVRRWS
jgi:hypothetical protein